MSPQVQPSQTRLSQKQRQPGQDACPGVVSERAGGKPAYVVFDDKTLWLVAATLPVKEADLLAINGIGPVKLENYGDELISIAEELRAH